MAILYRCDILRMGWELNIISPVRRGLIKKTYNAELIYDGKAAPCVATFYPGDSYKIEYINDHGQEQDVCHKFMDMLSGRPGLLFEYLARTLMKIMSVTVMAASLMLILNFGITVGTGGEHTVAPLSFYMYAISFLGAGLIKYLLNLV